MKKNLIVIPFMEIQPKKLLRIMKIITFFMFMGMISCFAGVYSQDAVISLDMKNSTLLELFNAIEENTDYKIFYKTSIIDENQTISLAVDETPVSELLSMVLPKHHLTFDLVDKVIVITPEEGYMQPIKITGSVKDAATGEPLIGVNIMVEGTATGAVTDVNGIYSIDISDSNEVLLYSFIGYNTERVEITGRSVINLNLVPDITKLEEVVVVGYGTVKRSDLTGSVSQINADQFERASATNALQALQGRAAGLSITPSSGQPGAGNDVLIHGTRSINGSSSPIYVVDGTISGNIDNINPQDIETITVLKDASTVAIYGSRAANGVILVTTKRGSKTKAPVINFSTKQSIQQQGNLEVDYVNAAQWIELMTEAYQNSGITIPWTQEDLDEYTGVDVNWPKNVMRTGALSTYDLSVEGGGDKSNYLVSAGYLYNKGIIIGQDYKRLNFRINTDHKVNKVITFGNSLNLYYSSQTSNTEVDERNIYTAAFRYTPLNREYETNGDVASIRNSNLEGRSPSPLWMYRNSAMDYKTKGLSGNLYLTLEILKGLKFTTRGSLEYSNRDRDKFIGAMDPHYNMEGSNVNVVQKNNEQSIHWISDFLLDYNKTFFDNHSVSALLGYSLEESTWEDLWGRRGGTPNNGIRYLNAGDPTTSVNGNGFSDWAFVSMFGRLNYTFKEKYLLSGTIRRDGTSRLAQGTKYGTFPSVSAAWRISRESFMSNIGWLNDLKLRASYGTLGNVGGLSDYATSSALSSYNPILNDKPIVGYTMANAINTDLKWESTTKKNIGLDAYLFDNKFYFIGDYYVENTNDLLFRQELPYSAGFSGMPFINAGEVRNKGFDIELGYRKKAGDWSYDVSVNYTHSKNEVVDLDGRNLTSQGVQVGYPLFTAYGYRTNGIIRSEADLAEPQLAGKKIGDIWFLDINGKDAEGKLTGEPDGVVNGDDRTLIGKVYPDFTYGAFASVAYKNLTLQIQLQGIQGIDRDMRGGRATDGFAGEPNVEADYILDRFHPTKNPDGNYPQVSKDDKGSNGALSDFWLRDASYLSIRNINLNYDLPVELIRKTGLVNCSIYGSVQNLYTFTSFYGTGIDVNFNPSLTTDTNAEGSNNMTSIPIPRIWTIGLRLTF
jgi:TonB-linked SusC/RagA family outer membrane protein